MCIYVSPITVQLGSDSQRRITRNFYLRLPLEFQRLVTKPLCSVSALLVSFSLSIISLGHLKKGLFFSNTGFFEDSSMDKKGAKLFEVYEGDD